MGSFVNIIVLVQYIKYIMQLSEQVHVSVSFTFCDIQAYFLDAFIYVKLDIYCSPAYRNEIFNTYFDTLVYFPLPVCEDKIEYKSFHS
jgi:hypothetical protein